MLDTKRLYRMARQIAYNKARHECPEQVAKDLQQAAWICYLKHGDHPYIWKDIEYAMLEEISRWNWACRRGRGGNRLIKLKASLKSWKPPLNTLHPERLMIIREEYEEARKDKRKFPVREYKMPAVRRNQKDRKAIRVSDPNSTKSKLTAGIKT